MKTAGIIAEYNPFHNGHAYHIQETRRLTGADCIIVIMSGDFVQRGEPALLDKYTRAAMALENGADLVLELPVVFSCASAETFAAGAVWTLDCLGVTDVLSFGCESADLTLLNQLACLYRNEPEDFSTCLKDLLRRGFTYPQARAAATKLVLSGSEDLQQVLASPNNILAIEYLKALKSIHSDITPLAVTRLGNYHSTALPDSGPEYASASAIRTLLFQHDIRTNPAIAGQLSRQVPPDVYRVLLSRQDYMKTDDFSSALGYALLSARNGDLTQYADITSDLSDRILGHLTEYSGWDSFTDLIKTRQMTRSRISRALLHLLLRISAEQINQLTEKPFSCYARVLGFRTKSRPLLTAIKQNSSIPMLTKMADAKKTLCTFYKDDDPVRRELALSVLETDLFAAQLYETTAASRYGRAQNDEFRHGILLH